MNFFHVENQCKIDGNRVCLTPDKILLEAEKEEKLFCYGNVVIKQHGKKYDIYILSATYYKLHEVYKNVDEYIYKEGALFIKPDPEHWIVMSAFEFSHMLDEENLEDKKAELPKLIIRQKGDIEFINIDPSCILINFENKGYRIGGTEKLIILEAGGIYEKIPIAYRAKLKEDNNTESFVNLLGSKKMGTDTFCDFYKIEEFKQEDYPMLEGYHGYWAKDKYDNICGCFIAGEHGYFGCEVCLNLKVPVQEMKFCYRNLLSGDRKSAIDVWKITKNGKESFIFQTIGYVDVNSIRFEIPKEYFE